MGFFDNFKAKATDLAQTGVAQSKRLAEIAKLKTANLAEEDAMKKAYIEIGKLYYAEKGAAPEGAFVAACEKITAAKAAVEANNDRIAELNKKEDSAEAEAVADAVEEVAEEAAEKVEEVAEKVEEVVEDVVEKVEEAIADQPEA